MFTTIDNYELGQGVDTSSLREVSKDEWAGLQQNYPNWMKSKTEKSFSIEDYKKNMAFDKNSIAVPVGANVTINFNNKDTIPHNFALYTNSSAATPATGAARPPRARCRH